MSKREQTPNEELANAITHGVGIVFCLIAMPFLFSRAWQDGSKSSFWGALAFGVGMTMVYTSSTLYHLIKDKHYKYQMRKVDHISIYFLIAGSYTPLIIPSEMFLRLKLFLCYHLTYCSIRRLVYQKPLPSDGLNQNQQQSWIFS